VQSRGSIVAIGMPSGAFLRAPVIDIVIRMISIRGSYVGNRLDALEAIDFFKRGLIKVPFQTAPLKELGHVYELMGWSSFSAALCVYDLDREHDAD